MTLKIGVEEAAPVVLLDVSQLRLDVRNPRRTSRDTEVSQLELLEEMYSRFDLDDLLASLATYGYFSEEPLIAVSEGSEGPSESTSSSEGVGDPDASPPAPEGSEGPSESTSSSEGVGDPVASPSAPEGSKGPSESTSSSEGVGDPGASPSALQGSKDSNPPFYTIVEGNRRLAALRILLFKDEREAIKARNIPEITGVAFPRLNPVPVKMYQTRAEVLPYLGVRHIVGVKQWEALAKARYIRDLIGDGHSMLEVAKQVGSGKRTDVVRRWLLTLYSIEQANDESPEAWDEVDEQFGFSWLYTSLGYRTVREYLGLSREVVSNPVKDPISSECLTNLIAHMKDLYGPPPGNPLEAAVRESRQIKDLAQVYSSSDAIAALRQGASLSVALRRTVSEEKQLVQSLRDADSNLAEASSVAPNHVGNEEAVQYARRCKQTAEMLVTTLEEA